MNSSMYIVIGILIVATGLLTFAAIWDHKPARAFGYSGLLAIFGGVGLNLYALRHTIDNVTYGWTAGFPSFAYDALLWIGIGLVFIANIIRLSQSKGSWIARMRSRRTKKSSVTQPAPARTRDTHEVVQ